MMFAVASVKRAETAFPGLHGAVEVVTRGRNVEMLYRAVGDLVVIYHAFTPPTKKFRREIDRLRGDRRTL